jgi:hypothetical protein
LKNKLTKKQINITFMPVLHARRSKFSKRMREMGECIFVFVLPASCVISMTKPGVASGLFSPKGED